MGGFAQQVWQRDEAAREDQQKMQLAPLQESLRADQTRLALYANPDDPAKALPGKEAEYSAVHNRMANTIGQMRALYGQKPQTPNPVEAGAGNLLDKLHITNHLKNHVAQARAAAEQKYQGQTQAMVGQEASAALPYSDTPAGQAEAQKTADALKVAGAKGTPDFKNIRGPNGETATIDLKKETIPAGWTLTGATPAEKPKKGLKPMEQGGVAFGVEDQDTGKQYLPSQLSPNGDAPPEAKQIWATIQAAQKAKRDAEDKKEDERTERQTRALAAVAERMGQAERFQEAMANYRSDLSTYRTLDNAARNSQTTVDSLNYQYAQPGNHAVADNELQNFYTTVVQKGGRKTAAELALTTKIGSFGMNIQTMAQKAASGELPDSLRKALLSGMSSVAAEQRKMADAAKPELPEVEGAPQGPTTKKNRQAQKNGSGWKPPSDAPAAPKQDGKLLKADGRVIAKSQGGQWVQP